MRDPEADCEIDEDLEEKILEEGDVVFSKSWNTGQPGSGGDSSCVYEFDGKYFAASEISGLVGPYDSLEAALKDNEDLLMVNSTTESMWSSLLNTSTIVKMLLLVDEDDTLQFTVNGAEWRYKKGKGFYPARSKRQR